MLQRSPKKLSDFDLMMLAAGLRPNPPTFPFWLHRMEKRATPRGYKLMWTGKTVDMTHHRVVRRGNKPVREAYIVVSKVYTLRDMRRALAVRHAQRQWRVQ